MSDIEYDSDNSVVRNINIFVDKNSSKESSFYGSYQSSFEEKCMDLYLQKSIHENKKNKDALNILNDELKIKIQNVEIKFYFYIYN